MEVKREENKMFKKNSVIQKRITKTQYQDIIDSKAHFSWLLEFFIIQKNDESYHVVVKIKKIFFPIAFILELICQFFYCLWNEGLKNIILRTSRTIDSYYIMIDNPNYKKTIQYFNM